MVKDYYISYGWWFKLDTVELKYHALYLHEKKVVKFQNVN